MKRKHIGAVVLMTALLLLSACGEESAEDAPHYTVAGEMFPTLPTEEEAEIQIYGTGDAVTRTYTEFSDPKQVVSDYVTLMTGEYGFQVVTEVLIPQDIPSEYEEEGEIYLGRVTESGDKTILFELVWSPESCIVVSSLIPALIQENTADVMGVGETLSYVESLSPTDLGLEGGSMDEYAVYIQDSVVLVNGMRCMQVDIYSQSGEHGGNALEGNYLMSYSGQLYRLDRATNTVERLEGLPSAAPETEDGEDTSAPEDEDAQTQPEEDGSDRMSAME